MLKVAINGFGRIGRNVLRAVYESGKHQQIKVVAVNELAQPEAMAHLLQYDTSHGRFGKKISHDQEHLYVHHNSCNHVAGEYDALRILHLADIELLPWRDLEVDIVLDCTGVYGCKADGLAHIEAGAKKVYLASAAPEVRYPNVYGIDMPSANELIAYGREIEQISELIRADGLIFQDISDLVDAVSELNPEIKRFETSVFDGNYITGDVDHSYLERIDNIRNEGAKNKGIQAELSNLEMHNMGHSSERS